MGLSSALWKAIRRTVAQLLGPVRTIRILYRSVPSRGWSLMSDTSALEVLTYIFEAC
jgi:hypothetical protein